MCVLSQVDGTLKVDAPSWLKTPFLCGRRASCGRCVRCGRWTDGRWVSAGFWWGGRAVHVPSGFRGGGSSTSTTGVTGAWVLTLRGGEHAGAHSPLVVF